MLIGLVKNYFDSILVIDISLLVLIFQAQLAGTDTLPRVGPEGGVEGVPRLHHGSGGGVVR